MHTNISPSGRQIHIECGEISAEIVEVGGGLRQVRRGDFDLLDGYGRSEMCHDGRGQILIPWPNRLAGGRYRFGGVNEQLPLNEPSLDNAIHGLVRWSSWTFDAVEADSVTALHRVYPQPGYPFSLELTAHYRVTESGLSVTLGAENTGPDECPFGAGQHPYLRVDAGKLDGWLVHIPAQSMCRYDEHLIPAGRVGTGGTPLDFRRMRAVGTTQLNTDYTDLERDDDGYCRVRVRSDRTGREVALWMDGSFTHVTVYTGETVQPKSRRRHGLAIEPMTCPPNAFNSQDDLIVLEPGERWNGTWGIEVRR